MKTTRGTVLLLIMIAAVASVFSILIVSHQYKAVPADQSVRLSQVEKNTSVYPVLDLSADNTASEIGINEIISEDLADTEKAVDIDGPRVDAGGKEKGMFGDIRTEEDLPEIFPVLEEGEQMPLPAEWFDENGEVKPEYETALQRRLYFGNPVYPDKLDEYYAYIENLKKGVDDLYSRLGIIKKTDPAEEDPLYAGMTPEEVEELRILKNSHPKDWAIAVGLWEKDAPWVTFDEVKELSEIYKDPEVMVREIQRRYPFSDCKQNLNLHPVNLFTYYLDDGYLLIITQTAKSKGEAVWDWYVALGWGTKPVLFPETWLQGSEE
ncbi:MAG: hypothetical protein ILP12_07010 [Lachnospiraceae bacterium]|nr:hypothetical protein [Lachnospiraceae bacterium]